MTDEGQNAMDTIEMLTAMRDLAAGCRAFYDELVEQGFSKLEALALAAAWISNVGKGDSS